MSDVELAGISIQLFSAALGSLVAILSWKPANKTVAQRFAEFLRKNNNKFYNILVDSFIVIGFAVVIAVGFIFGPGWGMTIFFPSAIALFFLAWLLYGFLQKPQRALAVLGAVAAFFGLGVALELIAFLNNR